MRIRQTAAVCFAVFLLHPAALHAADWILAALPFSVSSVQAPDIAAALSVQIPQLMLESLSAVDTHIPSGIEMQYRKSASLRAERNSLLNELSSALKDRDGLMLSELNQRALRVKQNEKDAQIREIERKLSENAAALEKLKTVSESGRILNTEPVVLWKKDSSALFSVPAGSEVPSSAAQFEKAVSEAKINALISGSVSVIGRYVSVTASLEIYPGNIHAGSVTESGSLTDTVEIAERLARSLIPIIRNAAPVMVVFDIQPEEAAASAQITVDGSLLASSKNAKNGIALDSGMHTVTVESQGFKTTSFTYDFSSESAFQAVIRLEKLEPKTVTFDLDVPMPGLFFINGLAAGPGPAQAAVNSNIVLGEFIGTLENPDASDVSQKQQISTYFVADLNKTSLRNISATIKADTQDISARIEKRRKTMYNSYSALLVSLIPSIAAYGMYANTYNGWAMGYKAEQEMRVWKTVSDCSIALSVGFGINFIVQLGRYIFAANAILPETAEIGD